MAIYRGTGCVATRPLDLELTARIGLGDILSELGAEATVQVWVGGAFHGAIGRDLTYDGRGGRARTGGISIVDGTIDGDLGDIAVGRDEGRKKKREECQVDHDETTKD